MSETERSYVAEKQVNQIVTSWIVYSSNWWNHITRASNVFTVTSYQPSYLTCQG